MVQFNFAEKQIKAKVVYYGPAQSGKTTNLEQVHVLTDPAGANRLVSLNTSQDRTLFFDLLPFSLGTVSGYDFQVQLYTVPGQVQYNATRRVVLAGADAVVFIADSRKSMAKENQAAFENMKVNLLANRLVPEKVPLVLQWNKQDLPDLLPEDELNRLMNPWDRPAIKAVASDGQGVMDTFSTIVKQMLHAIAVKYNLKQKGLDPDQVPEMVETAFSKLMEAAGSAQPIAIMLDDSEEDPSAEKAPPKPAKIVLAQSPDASQAGALQASPDAGLVAEELLQRAIKSNIDLAETLADVVKQINAGLGKIAMQAQKLKSLTAEDSQERKAVDVLMNEAGSLAEVVQNLGQASKGAGAVAAGLQSHPPIARPATKPPGVGSGPPKAAPDIGTAMRDAVNKLRTTLEERGVRVDLMVSGVSPPEPTLPRHRSEGCGRSRRRRLRDHGKRSEDDATLREEARHPAWPQRRANAAGFLDGRHDPRRDTAPRGSTARSAGLGRRLARRSLASRSRDGRLRPLRPPGHRWSGDAAVSARQLTLPIVILEGVQPGTRPKDLSGSRGRWSPALVVAPRLPRGKAAIRPRCGILRPEED